MLLSYQQKLLVASGPQLGGVKRGRRPPKQKFRPLNLPACPPKLPLPSRLFEKEALLIGNQQRTRRKVDQYGPITFFFF